MVKNLNIVTSKLNFPFIQLQGYRILFDDGSRIIYRLSGTGSTGATIRVYIESYKSDQSEVLRDVHEALNPLIHIALELCQLKKHTGRDKPTVIT